MKKIIISVAIYITALFIGIVIGKLDQRISTAPEKCERLVDGSCEVWCGDRIKQ